MGSWLVGRVSTRGHWLLHIADRFGQQGNVDQKEAIRNALQSTAQLLADMNGSNPVLCSPIKDSQAADTVTHSVAFNEKFPEQLVNPPLQRS